MTSIVSLAVCATKTDPLSKYTSAWSNPPEEWVGSLTNPEHFRILEHPTSALIFVVVNAVAGN